MKWNRLADVRCPPGQYIWMYSRLDGVYIGFKGIGSDDWYTCEHGRVSAPTHWMNLAYPAPPED